MCGICGIYNIQSQVPVAFRTQSDTEVIVHAYEEYGTECFARLHGMFGLAIWDERRQRLLLARDRPGKKPLYYTRVGGDLLFASEIKALFCDPRVSRQADLQSLADFLSVRYVPGPATLFKDIYKVQAGHWLLFERENAREECYWDFSFEPLERHRAFATATYLDGIRQHVRRSVAERMRKLKTAARALAEPDSQRWVNWFGIFNGSLKEQLLASSLQAQVDMHAGRIFQRWLDEHPQRDNLSRMLNLDTKIWLPDNLLMKNDKMTMAASVEGRIPLLDEHLVAYAASIPSHLKVHGWQTKYIFKQAYADFLPQTILTRKKMGFNMPTGTWFREGQRAFITGLLLSERMSSRGLFDHTCIERLLRDHLDGRSNYQAQLFTLASLELWFRVFIDPPTLDAPQELLAFAAQ